MFAFLREYCLFIKRLWCSIRLYRVHSFTNLALWI